MTAKQDKQAGAKPKSFEQSMERLEEIVGEMEGGSLSLDNMIARFEEGQKLIEFCSSKLNEVERKIEALVKKDDGTLETEPLDSASQDVIASGEESEPPGEIELF